MTWTKEGGRSRIVEVRIRVVICIQLKARWWKFAWLASRESLWLCGTGSQSWASAFYGISSQRESYRDAAKKTSFGAAQTDESKCSLLMSWTKRAAELTMDETKLHSGLGPHLANRLEGKPFLIFERPWSHLDILTLH